MTCRIWSRSRMRRGSGNPRTLLLICGVLVFSAKLFLGAASPAFAISAGMNANFVANASSTSWASATDNWFFAVSRRCAHSAASSAELRPSIWRSKPPTVQAAAKQKRAYFRRRDLQSEPNQVAGRHCRRTCC